MFTHFLLYFLAMWEVIACSTWNGHKLACWDPIKLMFCYFSLSNHFNILQSTIHILPFVSSPAASCRFSCRFLSFLEVFWIKWFFFALFSFFPFILLILTFLDFYVACIKTRYYCDRFCDAATRKKGSWYRKKVFWWMQILVLKHCSADQFEFARLLYLAF